jgi:hypothetical protein
MSRTVTIKRELVSGAGRLAISPSLNRVWVLHTASDREDDLHYVNSSSCQLRLCRSRRSSTVRQ